VAYRAEIEIGVKGAAKLEQLKKTVQSINQRVDKLKTSWERIRDGVPTREFGEVNKKLQKTTALQARYKALAAATEKRLQGHSRVTSGLLRLNKAVLNAARSEAQARGESAAKQRELNRELAKSQQYSKPQQQRAGGTAGKSGVGQLAGRLGVAAAAIAAVRGVARLGNESAVTAAELSKLGIALEGVLGKNAAEGFAAIDRAARDFNQPIVDATQNFTQLSAAAAVNGNTVKEIETLYRGLSAATKATGGDAEDLSGVLRAATQVISKGVVRSEELRGQIGDRLPGAFQLFAQATNRSAEELQKALEQGEVSADEFVTTFANFILNKYEPAAKKIGDSPAEAGARLTKALEDANRAAGPLLAALGAKFQEFATKTIRFLTPLANYLNDLFNFTPATTAGLEKVGKQLLDVDRKIAANQEKLDKATNDRTRRATQENIDSLERRRQQFVKEFNRITAALPSKTEEGAPLLKKTTVDTDLKGAPKAPKLPVSKGPRLQQQITQELLKQFDIKTNYMKLNMSELDALDFQNTRLRERLQREEQLLELQRQEALANSKYAADAELINSLFDLRKVTIQGATEAQIQQNLASADQLKIQKEITKLKQQEQLEELERGLRRDISDVERRIASPFGGDEAEQANLIIEQTRRYNDEIGKLTASIAIEKALGKESDQAKIAALEDRRVMLELLLPVLNEVEQAELRQNQALEKYGFIADEAATALSSAFQSIITGTGSVQEAFSDMFANIGKAFIDMATQMLAQKAILSLLEALGGGIGGPSLGGGGNGAFNIGKALTGRATGGPVNANQPYIVGERGPELLIPSNQGRIVSNENLRSEMDRSAATRSAMARNPGAGAIDVRYSVERINNVDYVTAEEFQQGMSQAAKQGAIQGEQRAMRTLKNSVSTRRSVGF
jgi:tape measure domain-containing protein